MTSPMFPAVENVGREVVLIRDNKVIGEGYSVTKAGGIVSIEMRDDAAKALIENSMQVKVLAESFPEKKYKWAYFRFFGFDGSYADSEDDRYHAEFENVRVVDKFNLRYGIVPDSFKDVEGCGAIHNRDDADDGEPDEEVVWDKK